MKVQTGHVRAHTVKSLFLTGCCMGIANVIPGISGATAAFVLGIYSELVNSIRKLNPLQIGLLLQNYFMLSRTNRRRRIDDLEKSLCLPFLAPLVLGVAVAFALASYIFPLLFAWYPQQINSLFFGLMLASVVGPISVIPKKSFLIWMIVLFFAWLAYSLVALPRLSMSGSLYFTFFSGAIAVCAVILPGISGGYLLQALGLYEFILGSLHQALYLQADALFVVLVFVAGMILGITSFVRILSWALRYHHIQTYAALTGMMLGALRAVWPFQNMQTHYVYFPSSFGMPEVICLVLFLTGILMTGVLFRFDRRAFKKVL